MIPMALEQQLSSTRLSRTTMETFTLADATTICHKSRALSVMVTRLPSIIWHCQSTLQRAHSSTRDMARSLLHHLSSEWRITRMARTTGVFAQMASDRELRAIPQSVRWSTLLQKHQMNWLNEERATARDVNDDTAATFTDLLQVVQTIS